VRPIADLAPSRTPSPTLPGILAGALLSVLLCPAVLPAQSFGEEISVTEVDIPVRVLRGTDPLRGLTADDFEVFDDGERQEIVGFRVIDLARGAERSGTLRPPAEGEEVREEGRNILVLFDFVFARSHYLERSLVGTREMIRHQLHPSDRVAVAYLTGGGANLLLGFTENRREIDLALGAIQALLGRRHDEVQSSFAELEHALESDDAGRDEPKSRVARMNERFGATATLAMLGATGSVPGNAGGSAFGSGPWSGDIGDGGGFRDPTLSTVGSGDNPFRIARSLAGSAQASAIRTVSQEVSRLATLLRDVRGQKEMVYLSEGFAPGILNDFASSTRALALRYLEQMFESLRRGGWTLHAIDVGGIPNPFAGPGFSADSLHYMSAETGGTLLENYNRIDLATAELLERTSVTYVLTIHPGELPADGRYHPIEVRLRDGIGRARLDHRPGYYAPKPAADRSPLERQLDAAQLLLGDEEIEQIAVGVRTGSLPADSGVATVPIVVEVPTRALVTGSRERPLEFELQAYALDPEGGVQDLWLRSLRLDPAESPTERLGNALARGGFRVLGAMALPPGEYRLRVLVRETGDDRLFLSTAPLTVPSGDSGLLPLDPLVVDRSGSWIELAALPAGAPGAAQAVFRPRGHLVVPPIAPVSTRGERLELMVPIATSEPVELSGRLLAADGRSTPVTVRFDERPVETEGGLAVYSAWLDTEVPAGEYDLELEARRSGSEERSVRISRLRVRE
jgi:VWFA-related protein